MHNKGVQNRLAQTRPWSDGYVFRLLFSADVAAFILFTGVIGNASDARLVLTRTSCPKRASRFIAGQAAQKGETPVIRFTAGHALELLGRAAIPYSRTGRSAAGCAGRRSAKSKNWALIFLLAFMLVV